jgi:hypothetical protein
VVNAALKAMSIWRNEIVDVHERNGEPIIDNMALAAARLGWPEQLVRTTHAQIQSIAEMQVKTIDRMMDAWGEQITDRFIS